MTELQLIKSERFGEIEADIYSNGKDMFMTINQLAACLEYADRSGIQKLVDRNEYLNKPEFSCWDKSSHESGAKKTRIFTEDGIYEVTMLSGQPKAKEFRAWIRGVLKALRAGKAKLIAADPTKKSLAEAKLNNSRARLSSMWLSSDYLSVSGTYNDGLFTRLESNRLDAGKTYTTSLLLSDGTVLSATFVCPNKDGAVISNAYSNGWGVVVEHAGGAWSIYVAITYLNTPQTLNIVAAKLELGSVSTLHLDTPPSPAEQELNRQVCQRYYQRFINGIYASCYTNGYLTGFLLPTKMRIAPTLTFTNVLKLSDFSYKTPGTQSITSDAGVSCFNVPDAVLGENYRVDLVEVYADL